MIGSQKDSFYRKPNSGMLELSRRFYPNLSLSKSFLVGDKISDCMAGLNFGLPHANLLIQRINDFKNLYLMDVNEINTLNMKVNSKMHLRII